MRKSKLLALMLALVSIFALTFALAACGGDDDKHTTHTWESGECTVCHEKHTGHTDTDKDGKCDTCGATVEPETPAHTTHTWVNGECSECHEKHTDHADANNDGKCDTCKAAFAVVYAKSYTNAETLADTNFLGEMTSTRGGEEMMNLLEENTLTLNTDGTYTLRKRLHQTNEWAAVGAMFPGREVPFLDIDVTFTGTYTRIKNTNMVNLDEPTSYTAHICYGFMGKDYMGLWQALEGEITDEDDAQYFDYFPGAFYDEATVAGPAVITVNANGTFAYEE